MTADILVIGDVMTDIIVRPLGQPVRGSDCPASIRERPGGSGANQAAWLGALGGRVALFGRVGAEDHAAHTAALRRHGVRTHLAADADLPTGRLVCLLDPDGERSFLTDRGANDALCRADLPDAALGGAKLLHISGYSLFGAAPRAAVLDFAAAARRRGLAVTFDAASSGPILAAGPAQFLDWTRGGDALFVNADEAEALVGGGDWTAHLARLAPLFATVVLKRGAAGAVAMSGGEVAQVPAEAIAPLDTTGAGDAFLAGFLLARLDGATLSACLAAGARQGAKAARQLGGRP